MDILALLLLVGYALFWGLRKGSVLCAVVCAPGLVPYVSERGGGWKRGVWMGIIFNLPRIVLLTIIGFGIGAFFFILGDITGLREGTTGLGIAGLIGYVAVGIFLAVYGLVSLAKALDEREDIKEGKVCHVHPEKLGAPHGRFARWVATKVGGTKEGAFLSVWGGVLGLACVGETLVALEATILGGGAGAMASSIWIAGGLGALVMFAFSIGAAIPVILVTAASGEYGNKLGSAQKMNTFKLVSSVAMIAIGLILVILMGVKLLMAL